MRSRGIALAAMLAMAPLSASAADLVVWWEKGQYDEEDQAVREISAAFEEKTNKEVELVLEKHEKLRDDTLAAIKAGRPLPTSSSPLSPFNTTNDGLLRDGSSSSPMRSDR